MHTNSKDVHLPFINQWGLLGLKPSDVCRDLEFSRVLKARHLVVGFCYGC